MKAPPPASTDSTPPAEENEPSILRGDPVELTIDHPESVRIGDDAAFAMTLRNAHQQPLDGVTVLCELPEGLSYPGATERAFRQRVGRLEPGEQRKLDLVLRADQAGAQCVEVRVSAEGFDDLSRSACVLCRDESVRLDISGPQQRVAGARAEFVVTLANLTGRELPDVHVLLVHDGALEPREASAGMRRSAGRLEWDLGLVRIDERVQIQVEFSCDRAVDAACLTARVAGRDLDPREVSSCLQVLAAREIELDVSDEQDPVTVGESVRYMVRVTNHQTEAASGLLLQFHPQGVQPLGVTVDGEDALALSTFDAATGLLSVPLPGPLRGQTTQVVTVQTTAIHAGAGGLAATLIHKSGSISVTAAEPTVVNSVPGSIAADDP